jgi:uncharacterized coiled-coil protein SlyX
MASPASAPTSESFQLQMQISDLQKRLAFAEDNIEILQDLVMRQKRRIDSLANVQVEVTEKTDVRLNKLYDCLADATMAGQIGMPFKQAAREVGITRQRLSQLRDLIAKDERFALSKHPSHKAKWIVSLSPKSLHDLKKVKTANLHLHQTGECK